nr:chitinase [Anaerocolumna aminovalerica]
MKGKKIWSFLLMCLMIAVTIGKNPITSYAQSGLPTHLLTGYWQNFNNGAKCLRISDVPVSYDIIAVAFADATSTPGAVSFTLDSGLSSALGGYTESQFISDIAAVKGRGQKVIISVGGQNGTIRVEDSNAATNFANSVYSLMTKYGFDGVDIDLENGVNPTYMASALRSLSSKAGPGLIITMAPETIYMQSPSSSYFQLALNIKDILTIVNTQYYNSGAMLGYDGKVYSQGTVDFLTALATIQLENGLRPDQVGLGLPASPSGAGGGYVSPTVVNAALDCLYNGSNGGTFKPPHTYPTIRGAMTWSINWDASNGYNFANTVKPDRKSVV